jgi:hypothetical protein
MVNGDQINESAKNLHTTPILIRPGSP